MGSSPYTDLERPPLSEARLRRALLVPGEVWTDLRYLPTTGSTNADVAAAARAGTPEGLIIVADEQTAGRGRLDRQWRSPRAAGIAVSVLLRPGRADAERGWAPVPTGRLAMLPLLAGVALVETVRRLGEVDASLKWPNDLLIGDRKCAGILAEAVTAVAAGAGGTAVAGGSTAPETSVVLGIGLNVTLRQSELPRPDATSLQLAGASCVDRDPILRSFLRSLGDWYARWRAEAGDPVASGLLETYRFHCATIGRSVRVTLPGDESIVGIAESVDDDGCLVVAGRSIAAGDVVHLRAN